MNTVESAGAAQRTGVEEHDMMIIKNNQIESEKFQYQLSKVDTQVKNFKIKSNKESTKKKKVKYPTQWMMVG